MTHDLSLGVLVELALRRAGHAATTVALLVASSACTTSVAPAPIAAPARQAGVAASPPSVGAPAVTSPAGGAPSVEAPAAAPPSVAPPPAEAPAEAPAQAPPPGFVPIPERRAAGFPGVDFASVRAFAFDLAVRDRPVCQGPLDADGTLCATVQRPGVLLTGEQVAKLLGLLARRDTFGGGASCFLPHHGFVFHDAAGTPVAELSVCFLCDMVAPLPAVPAAGRSADGRRVGISEQGRTGLLELCRELGLPQCDAKSPDDFGTPSR